MSIYITGDTHIPIDIHKLSTKNFPEQQNMSHENDFLIICGDFGGVWDGSNEEKYWLKWLSEKKFTTLFVDGNHENHTMLSQNYPKISFHNGYAQEVARNVFHLCRGNIFEIDGVKIFAMGGASSHDKTYRKENVSWWKEELPSNDEYNFALKTLDENRWGVDLVISHCASDSVQFLVSEYYEHNKLTNFFESIKSTLLYDKWYFGHYHIDKYITPNDIAVYNKIIKYK